MKHSWSLLLAACLLFAHGQGSLTAHRGVTPPDEIFPKKGIAAPAMHDICSALRLDAVVAKDTDPPWHDPSSWIWTETPAYANRYVRVFTCTARSTGTP